MGYIINLFSPNYFCTGTGNGQKNDEQSNFLRKTLPLLQFSHKKKLITPQGKLALSKITLTVPWPGIYNKSQIAPYQSIPNTTGHEYKKRRRAIGRGGGGRG
jgi:hypothetical protein